MVSFYPLSQTELPFCADQLLRHRLDFGPIPTAHRDVCSRPLKSSLLLLAGMPNHLAVECADSGNIATCLERPSAFTQREGPEYLYTWPPSHALVAHPSRARVL